MRDPPPLFLFVEVLVRVIDATFDMRLTFIGCVACGTKALIRCPSSSLEIKQISIWAHSMKDTTGHDQTGLFNNFFFFFE